MFLNTLFKIITCIKCIKGSEVIFHLLSNLEISFQSRRLRRQSVTMIGHLLLEFKHTVGAEGRHQGCWPLASLLLVS